VLSQLGNRVHHVIRAFTPNDVKALNETIKTFPHSAFYDMEKQFTALGTGQAFITVLNEKGIPTETVVTHLAPPASVMGPLAAAECQAMMQASEMFRKYSDSVDPESAHEILTRRMEDATTGQPQPQRTQGAATSRRSDKSTFDQVLSSPVAKQVGREIVRGVFGMLFGSTPRRRRY
jgi:hypothetical protein